MATFVFHVDGEKFQIPNLTEAEVQLLRSAGKKLMQFVADAARESTKKYAQNELNRQHDSWVKRFDTLSAELQAANARAEYLAKKPAAIGDTAAAAASDLNLNVTVTPSAPAGVRVERDRFGNVLALTPVGG